MFGTLHPDGTLTNVRVIPQSTFANCPFYIMVPEHYREDGSCKCDDPEHRRMMKKEWGYTKKNFVEAGVIGKSDDCFFYPRKKKVDKAIKTMLGK